VTRSGPKWLVTGASGFLGSNFGAMRHQGHYVALTRSDQISTGFESHVVADLVDEDQLTRAVEITRPDYILHAAALASHEECEQNPVLAHEVNARSTETLAKAAQRVGSKFVYISTDAVFDGLRGNDTEADTPAPFSVYGATKLQGEIAAREANPNSLILRTNFFGWSPNGTRSILEFFVNNLERDKPINGFTDFTVTSMYAGDLVRVIHQLRNQIGTWHVASPDSLSKYEFGCAIAEEFGFNPNLITPVSGKGEISRSRDISLNTDKLKSYLRSNGLPAPLSQREGIKRAHQNQNQRTVKP
jgi:dTDP-4-dehydrorhamnose reductase